MLRLLDEQLLMKLGSQNSNKHRKVKYYLIKRKKSLNILSFLLISSNLDVSASMFIPEPNLFRSSSNRIRSSSLAIASAIALSSSSLDSNSKQTGRGT